MQRRNLKKIFVSVAAVGALALSACDGKNGLPGANGLNGSAVTQVSQLSTDQWEGLKMQAEVTGVTINSPPVVKFKVTDASGNPVIGLGNTTQSATATLPGYSNISFALAKLVPANATTGAPSRWVSYIVTTVPSYTSATDKTIIPSKGTRPTTDNTGTLVDNGDGTYQYTFYRDVTKVKDVVAAATNYTSSEKPVDLDDLTYDPTLPHRLTIQIAGNKRNTGTNTPNGSQAVDGSGTAIAASVMKNPINLIYDFIPATGKAVSTRDIVSTDACVDCHTKFTFHGGSRQDVRYCMVCHTDQRKFGRTEATQDASGNFPAITRDANGNITSAATYRINGESVANMPSFIHRIHKGKELTKQNYNYANVLFNEVTYPQAITNCAKCHSKSDATPQGDNWKTSPSRLACGSCHETVNFATGANHVGGIAANDSACATCHGAAAIAAYHVTVDPTGANGRGGYPLNTADNVPLAGYLSGQGPAIPLASQQNLPAGVYKIGFEISQVTVTGAAGAKKASVKFKITKDGQAVTFNPTGYLINNVDGTPSVYVTYATVAGTPNATDGIANPADWNKSISATVLELRGGSKGTLVNNGDGTYTANLSTVIPDDAKMVTGALGINYNGFVQLGLTAYPNGIRLREPAFAMKTADGFTARRSIVSNAKCNKCHAQLGVSPSFHSGARNNGEGCSLGGCHDPNKATGHIGAANNFGGGWSVSAKDMIHGIHGSGKRTVYFNYEATASNPDGFKEVTYPAILQNCEACHVAGSYDFSATANKAALPNLLWSSAANGDMTGSTALNSIGLSPWFARLGLTPGNYGTSRAANLVVSPITAACLGCHDTVTAVNHMKQNGGVIYGAVTTSVEACMTCHASGKIADIKAAHQF